MTGKEIRMWRLAREWTQKDMKEKLNIDASTTTIGRVEHDKKDEFPSVQIAKREILAGIKKIQEGKAIEPKKHEVQQNLFKEKINSIGKQMTVPSISQVCQHLAEHLNDMQLQLSGSQGVLRNDTGMKSAKSLAFCSHYLLPILTDIVKMGDRLQVHTPATERLLKELQEDLKKSPQR